MIFYFVSLIFIDDPGNIVETNCNIISTSLPTVTATGGVIPNGTQNVILYCICTRNTSVAVGPTMWYFNGAPVNLSETDEIDGNPYYRNNVPSPLIIPYFVAPHDGTYSCERYTNESRDTITLTLPGMHV